MISIFFLLQTLLAREVPLHETCSGHLTGLGCEDPARLAQHGLKAYAEELEHGQRVFIVPCVGNAEHSMYVAYTGQGESVRTLMFDQWVFGAGFQSRSTLVTGHLSVHDGRLESEFQGLKGRYVFRGRPDGVSLHLIEQTLRHADGREELLYYQRSN